MMENKFPKILGVLFYDKGVRFLFLLFTVLKYVSPQENTKSTASHIGTNFSFALMENSIYNRTASVTLQITNIEDQDIWYTINSTSFNKSEIISASNYILCLLPYKLVMKGTELAPKAIHVNTETTIHNSPAILYLFVNGTDASDSTLILPDSALGDKYYVLTYCEILGICQITIASDSSANVKSVRIQLPTVAFINVSFQNREYTSGQSIYVNLTNNESVQVQCKCDLSGTFIESRGGNIAVFAGSAGTVVGVWGNLDFLFEQMVPISAWGKEYIAYASSLRQTGDYIRIIASINDTVVRISGYKKTVQINAGNFIHRRIESGSGIYIHANKPVMVLQFTHNGPSKIQDSSMFIVQAHEQYTNKYIFDTVFGDYDKYHIALFTNLVEGISDIFLNESRIDSYPTTSVQEKNKGIDFLVVQHGRNVIESNSSFGGYLLIDIEGRMFSQLIGTRMVNTTITNKPMVPGDEIDNDNDGMVDEDECEEKTLLTSTKSSDKDCGKIKGTSTNEGRKFLLVFPDNGAVAEVKLSVTTTTRTNITYSSPTTGNDYDYTETLNGIDEIIMSNEIFQQEILKTGIYNNSVLLNSTGNIALHASYISETSTYLYLALPVNALGLEYFAATYLQRLDNHPYYNTISIAAAYENTEVYIHLPYMDGGELIFNDRNYHEFEVITVKLKQFQIIHIRDEVDLTGTYIRGSNPIAVFSGSDHFLEQLYPVEYFGDLFVFPKIPAIFTDNILRTVASESNTLCSISQKDYTTFHNISNAGGKVDQNIIGSNSWFEIKCDKPVQTTLFAAYQGYGGFMTNIIPVQQYKRQYSFYALINNGTLGYSVCRLKNQFPIIEDFNGIKQNRSGNRFIQSFSNPGFANLTLTSRFANESFSAYIFTKLGEGLETEPSQMQGSPAGMKLSIKSTVCKPTNQKVNDQIDNDCDGLVDEDICVGDIYAYDPNTYLHNKGYILDFDLDGSLDEDCKYEISVPVFSTNLSFSVTSNRIAGTFRTKLELNTSYIFDTPTNYILSSESIIDYMKDTSTNKFLSTSRDIDITPSFEEDKTDTNTHFVFSSSDIQSSTSSAESMTDSRTHLSEMPSNDIQSIVSTEDTSLFLFATPSIHIQSTVSSTEIMKETGARSIVTSTWETLSTDMNKQSSTTQLLWTTSSIYHSRACKCPCSKVQAQAKYHNMTEEKLQSIIHETMKDLDIPKKNLSSSIRKRTSAKDDRPASTGIGYLGITILAVVFGCIIMSDLANLYRYFSDVAR